MTVILDSLATGASREEILLSYPTLAPVHIDATLAYATELAREESLLPLRPRVKVKLDENLPAELLDDLRAAGHEADTVHTEALPGRGPEPRGSGWTGLRSSR